MHTKKLTNILFVVSLTVVLLVIFGAQLTGSSEPASSSTLSAPKSTPQQLKGAILPGGVYRFTPAPIAGTSEPNPTLTLQVAILDADTSQAVRADILINGVLARSGVDRVEIKLPGSTDGITVTVRADGYVPWSQGLRYKLSHSRLLYLQAELTPLVIQSGALSAPTDLPFHPTLTPTSAQAVIALASPVPTLPTDKSAPTAALVAASGPPASPLSTPTHPHSPLPASTPPHSHTPTPTLTPTPSNPDAWWTWPCNTLRRDFPDGCEYAGEAAVAPPDHPLTPPCIRTAYTRTVPNDDYPEIMNIELTIVVDHPEYPSYTPGRDAQFVRLVLQPAYGGWYADHWQLGDPDWWYKCGLDEAPLAWALTEALNTCSFAPFSIAYNAPLPTQFIDLINDLIEVEQPTPSPTPSDPAAWCPALPCPLLSLPRWLSGI